MLIILYSLVNYKSHPIKHIWNHSQVLQFLNVGMTCQHDEQTKCRRKKFESTKPALHIISVLNTVSDHPI